MYEKPVIARGEIKNVVKPGLFEVELPNGKVSLGHFSKELDKAQPELNVGDIVTLELTPFDFDSARIAKIGFDA